MIESNYNSGKLFNYLKNKGFEKTEVSKDGKSIIIFEFGKEIFVYPEELNINHYYTTRKHLLANGWINNEQEFDHIFFN